MYRSTTTANCVCIVYRSTTTATPENAAAESAKSVLDLTDLSTEERFEIELQWCIEQIELGLQKKKPNPKQGFSEDRLTT